MAVFLCAVALLAVVGLSLGLLRGQRKTVDLSAGQAAADHILSNLIERAQREHDEFWNHEYPASGPAYREGSYVLNRTDFAYRMDAETAQSPAGQNIGGSSTQNRVKVVRLHLSWWGQSNNQRQGYGKLQYDCIRLVHER
ncbi:hypothetical protein JST97_25590 [bacterium]|nr:hypothetical protein [bacterium]